MNINMRLEDKDLTPRQIEVTKIVITGISNKEAASRLGIQEKGIKYHLTQVFKKVGVKNRIDLIRWAFGTQNFTETISTISEAEPPLPRSQLKTP